LSRSRRAVWTRAAPVPLFEYGKSPPASTLVYVCRVALPGWLIEIEAVATVDGQIPVISSQRVREVRPEKLLEAVQGSLSWDTGCFWLHRDDELRMQR
jgi:hypothetical protein